MKNTLTLLKRKPNIIYKHTLALNRVILSSKEEEVLKDYCKVLGYRLRSHNGLILLLYKGRSGYVQRDSENKLVFVDQIKVVKKGIINIKEDLNECLTFFIAFKYKNKDFFWKLLFKNGAFDDDKDKDGNVDVRKLCGLKFLEDKYEC